MEFPIVGEVFLDEGILNYADGNGHAAAILVVGATGLGWLGFMFLMKRTLLILSPQTKGLLEVILVDLDV